MNQQKSSFILQRLDLNHPDVQESFEGQKLNQVTTTQNSHGQSDSLQPIFYILTHKFSCSSAVPTEFSVLVYQADIFSTLKNTFYPSQLKLDTKLKKFIDLLSQEVRNEEAQAPPCRHFVHSFYKEQSQKNNHRKNFNMLAYSVYSKFCMNSPPKIEQPQEQFNNIVKEKQDNLVNKHQPHLEQSHLKNQARPDRAVEYTTSMKKNQPQQPKKINWANRKKANNFQNKLSLELQKSQLG